jgi:hypothetical protein
LPALDPGSDIGGLAGLPLRGFLLQGLVRTMPVIVPGVLGQDLAEMPLTEDQHVVQALAAECSHELCVPRMPSIALTSKVALPAVRP